MATKRLDPNVVKLIKILMASFDRDQITQTLNTIYSDIATDQQRKQYGDEWQAILRTIKHAKETRQKARIDRKKQNEY